MLLLNLRIPKCFETMMRVLAIPWGCELAQSGVVWTQQERELQTSPKKEAEGTKPEASFSTSKVNGWVIPIAKDVAQ